MNLGTVEISQESTHIPWECPLDDAVELPTVLINAAPTWECGSFHNEKQVFSSGQRRAAYFTSGLGLVLLASALSVLEHVNMAPLLGVTQPPSVTDHMGLLPLIADLQPAGPPYPAGQGSGPPVPLQNPRHQQCGRKSPQGKGWSE